MLILGACLIAMMVAWGVTRLMMAWAKPDLPDEARKLHTIPTPTSGGVGIMAGLLAGTAVLLLTHLDGASVSSWQAFGACLSLALAGGALGYWDDRVGLGARLKLGVMLCITLGFILAGMRIDSLPLWSGFALQFSPWLAGLGTLMWLLVMVNVVNFLDGANGMAMGCSGIGLIFLAMLSAEPAGIGPAALCLVGAAACLGFLYWNGLGGRIFAGDAGALAVGLLIGGLGVWAGERGANPWAIALCFLPMLSDAILTILWRARQRHNLLTAHAEHVYQLAIRTGTSHGQISLIYWLASAMCGALAVLTHPLGPNAVSASFGLALCGFVVILTQSRTILRKRLSKQIG